MGGEAVFSGDYRRYGYGSSLRGFLTADFVAPIGELTCASAFAVDQAQVAAWQGSVKCLREALTAFATGGYLFLEFDVPRLGRRIDAVLVLRHAVFVIEFKVGANAFLTADLDQVVDYALDLKYFHETSHDVPVVPILVATEARAVTVQAAMDAAVPNLFLPMRCTPETLGQGIALALELARVSGFLCEGPTMTMFRSPHATQEIYPRREAGRHPSRRAA